MRENEAVLGVRVFGLNVTVDGRGLGVADTGNLEGDIGRSPGADFERSAENGEILPKQVVGAFAEILDEASEAAGVNIRVITNLPAWRDSLWERHFAE